MSMREYSCSYHIVTSYSHHTVFYFSCPVGLDLESVDGTTVLGKLD